MRLATVTLALVWACFTISGTDGASAGTTATECKGMGLSYCNKCEDTDLRCHKCPANYALKSDNVTCSSCSISNCLECEYATSGTSFNCLRCATGYKVKSDSSACEQCSSNCISCETNGVGKCDNCSPGYYKVTANTCSVCGTQCKVCSASGTSTACTTCNTGYVKSANGKDCEGCISNCKTCSVVGECTACNTNWYVKADKTCGQCGSNCDICDTSTSTTCTTCVTGYAVNSGGTCVACVATSSSRTDYPWCDECTGSTADTACTTCKKGYGRNTDNKVTCDKCTASNCKTCNADQLQPQKCADCNTGYALDASSGTCKACNLITQCTSCTASGNAITCSSGGCATGYFLSDNKCHADLVGCPAANQRYNTTALVTYCDPSCSTDYVIKSGDNPTCAPCVNCPVCTYNSTTQATECGCSSGNPDTTQGTDQFRAQCVVNTYVCKEGYYYDDVNKACPSCSSTGCLHCNGSTAITGTRPCIRCKTAVSGSTSGYGATPLNSGSCQLCSTGKSNCQTCTVSNDVTTCTDCKAGYYVDNAGCTSCGVTGCSSCTSTGCTACTSSGTTYYAATPITVSGSKQCKTCGTQCTACTTSACSSCLAKHVKRDDSWDCVVCPTNCDTCANVTTSGVTTLTCNTGGCSSTYGFDTSTSLCRKCPNNCVTCSQSGSVAGNLVCDICASTYTKNGQTCAACPSNCETCSSTDGTVTCDPCKNGYYTGDSGKTCTACMSDCAKCSSASTCTECKIGFSLKADGSKCDTCAAATNVTNCATCTTHDMTKKLVVINGGMARARCDSCATNFAINQDNDECKSTSTISTNCMKIADMPPMCTDCQTVTGLTTANITGTPYCQVEMNCYECASESEDPTATCNVVSGASSTTRSCYNDLCHVMIGYDSSNVVKRAAKGCARDVTTVQQILAISVDTKICGPNQYLGQAGCIQICAAGASDLCNTYTLTAGATSYVQSCMVVMLLGLFMTAL